MTSPSAPSTLAPVQHLADQLRANIARILVGKNAAVDLALVALLCDGHLLIQDVPGIGKTTLAKALAASLGCTFRRLQSTPDLTPADVLGVSIFNQQTHSFEFHQGPIFTQVLLADEINRATPRTQSALLEAMQERQVTIDGVTHVLPWPFLVLATQNPVELEGTFPLPEAQLDRFMLRIKLGYPSAQEEGEILLRVQRNHAASTLTPVVSVEELRAAQAAVAEVRVDESLRTYMVRLVQATRRHNQVELGASPRAALALYRGGQALAAVRGRDYVLPDDVKALAEPALAHRLVLTPQARLRGQIAELVVSDVLRTEPVPVEPV
ncbi:MAG: MoxR family ATPase [Dehalococcoidia bacterium]|nr:MoxR family ATPase [Dehalococcoidia bacterium]